MSKIVLYHYTDKQGADGILKSEIIQGSTDATPTKRRRFGKGVYFTSIDPYNNPKDILLNNYDDAGHVINSRKLWDKIKWVVEVTLPKNKVKKVDEANRDVYLFEGDVNLKQYQYNIYQNPKA